MAKSLQSKARMLINALNQYDYKLVLINGEFIGREGAPQKYYTIKQGRWNPEKGRFDHKELYSAGSIIRIVMFLRDMWYEEQGWELPTDQELWNKCRKELNQ